MKSGSKSSPSVHSLPKEEPKEQASVKLWLDSYDDLFSDFDPRPYSKRTLSDDFISQAKKVTREESRKEFTLQLLLPEAVRNERDEDMIAQRLPLFFQKNYDHLAEEQRRTRLKGIKLVVFGVLLMVIGGYISYQGFEKFSTHLLLIIFEPAGWFLFWSGLDILLELSGTINKDLRFFSDMAHTKIVFGSY